MPGFAEGPEAMSPWKKRKRDQEDSTPLARPTSFTPFRVDYSNTDNGISHPFSRHQTEPDVAFRPRCLPRKRRHVHPSYLSIQPQQPSLLSPNLYAPKQDPYSPPVSPKSLVPIQCPSTSASALRPCHICHRRPTTRHVLDAYADCNLCGERACFICLRQCDSLACPGSVHVDLGTPLEQDSYSPNEDFDPEHPRIRRKICSRCAVEGISETGAETVRCMDCVQGHTSWPPISQWALDDSNDYMHS